MPSNEAGTSVTVAAPAKLNLYLHVLGRRDDGYHLLDSLIVFADLHDVVRAAPAGALTLDVTGPFAPALEGAPGNLILTAAERLSSAAGCREGAHITLVKNIPVAAGLGGGSADAAAALMALDQLWGLGLGAAGLADIAAGIGADVPVCLESRSAFAGGIGGELTPARLPPLWLVIANPGRPVATADVFGAFDGPFGSPARFTDVAEDVGALAALLRRRENQLTPAAAAMVPDIADLAAQLTALPGCELARMSGSGASCFGLFTHEAQARDGAGRLDRGHPGWWAASARLTEGRGGLTSI
ncbi:MAG: 4-(cytidine 5'-diphospho)-2-C-methyl-D-erythritol kinase [Alphaproteobacteria bacterium]